MNDSDRRGEEGTSTSARTASERHGAVNSSSRAPGTRKRSMRLAWPPTATDQTRGSVEQHRRSAAGKPPFPRVLAVANQKGGVGKTTTTVNLGAALAEIGYRVLVVDLDPQGNATTGLGVNARNLDTSIYDVLLHDVPDRGLHRADQPAQSVPGAGDDRLGRGRDRARSTFSRELRLKRAIAPSARRLRFRPDRLPAFARPADGERPSGGQRGRRPDPVRVSTHLEGLGQLLSNIERVRANLNPGLSVTTIIMTMFDARTSLGEQVVDEVRRHFGDKVCRSVVPRTVRLSEAPSYGQPIIVFDPTCRGATAYRD